MWLLNRLLSRLVRSGELILFEADGTRHDYGSPQHRRHPVTIRFTDRSAPRAIARNPRLGAAEAWMEGRLLVDGGDVLALIDLVQSNAAWEREDGDALLGNPLGSIAYSLMSRLDRLNWKRRSRRNVAHHYDLDAGLYDVFLDSDRQYSCGYFSDIAKDLEEAQADKKAHIASKLYLKSGQRVLDIGCGWGGLALYLNRVADVDVLGITLSLEQLGIARSRADEAGVADRVKFELIDYRDPALSEIVGASETVKLIVADVETLRLHYAHTLEHWYRRTIAAKEQIDTLY